jgi:signal transduction histidine kinase
MTDKANSTNNIGDAFFEIDSRILFELGEKLVTNRAVALAELVKNSYDADATYVTVTLEKIQKPGGRIIVKDNGSGMSLEKFLKTWMRIATIEKEQNPISNKYRRKKSGIKGIGRFACRRLSKKLQIISVSENESGEKEQLDVLFNWPEFTPGSDVNKIPISYISKIVDKENPNGTILILDQTLEPWGDMDIRKLRNELTDLISPVTITLPTEFTERPQDYDPGFNVEFICPEFPSKEESLKKAFFENAWAKIRGYIGLDGHAEYLLDINKKIITKGHRSFKKPDGFKLLKNCAFEIYIFSYRDDFFKGSEWGRFKAAEIGRDRGGVKLYADNFRVFGYGSSGDDWLGVDRERAKASTGIKSKKDLRSLIDRDSKPGLALFTNQALFGHVVYRRDDNPSLEITINRDRLIRSDSFDELVDFVRLGIDYATVVYANEIHIEQEQKDAKKRELEERKRKEEEEKLRRIEEAGKKAEEERKRAEIEREKAQEEALNAKREREKAEEERQKAEEERLQVEKERRDLEERWDREIKKNKALSELRAKEEQLLLAEKKAREKEIAIRKQESITREKAEKDRDTAIALLENELKIREEALSKLKLEFESEKKHQQLLFEQELLLLRTLASTGTLVLVIEHEIQGLIENMQEIVDDYESFLEKIPPEDKEKYTIAIESFKQKKEMIYQLGTLLGLTIGKTSRFDKDDWVFYPIIESVFKPFELYMKDLNIDYQITIPKDLRGPSMYRGEIISIFHNLMTNSFKALKEVPRDRRIEVSGYRDGNRIVINFLDTGIGISPHNREKIFQAFESDSVPDNRFGAGVGLGLKLVRDFLRSYDGDIKVIEPPKKWTTCFEFYLPVDEL